MLPRSFIDDHDRFPGPREKRLQDRTSTHRRFRLRGEADGQPIVHHLGIGETLLGSSRKSTLVLPASGVSRLHARVRWAGTEGEDPWPSVEDLDSKNGILLAGKPIREAPWREGQELELGSVRLRLEVVDPEDAELGLRIAPVEDSERADGASPDSLPTRDETTALPGGGSLSPSLVRLLDDLGGRLTLRPRPDLEGALGRLCRGLAAEGAALVESAGSGPPVVLVAAGRMGELPRPKSRRPRRDAAPQVVVTDPPEARVVVSLSLAASLERALVVWGDFPLRSTCGPWLGVLLRWIDQCWVDHCRPRQLASLEAPEAAPTSRQLEFPEGIVRGQSPSMVALYQQMESLLEGDLPVLILGETGVGKEHLAQLIHRGSDRRRRPFVAINCAAIPSELLEAEMFGIGRGVATGVQPRRGKFARAHQGTLFLDEIGELAPALQAKLLRAVQEKEIHPLGESVESVDVRVVAATNADLEDRMSTGAFRRDLYYRLAGEILRVPPLRERRDDVPGLVGHFVRRFAVDQRKAVQGVTVKALRELVEHPWPGNVRQLENEVRRLVHRCPTGGVIDFEAVAASGLDDGQAVLGLADGASTYDLPAQFEAVERRLIPRALARTRGNQTAAAKLLGISRNGLAKRLQRLGLRADPDEA